MVFKAERQFQGPRGGEKLDIYEHLKESQFEWNIQIEARVERGVR